MITLKRPCTDFASTKNINVTTGQAPMEKARAHVTIKGRVQGVFFRHHTQEMAFRLGVKGWVKNRWDGDVEAVFEGEKESLDQMILWCHQGPPQAKVTKVLLTWEEHRGEFSDFAIHY